MEYKLPEGIDGNQMVMDLVMKEIDDVWYFKGAGDLDRDFQNYSGMSYSPTAGQMLDILLGRYPNARVAIQSQAFEEQQTKLAGTY